MTERKIEFLSGEPKQNVLAGIARTPCKGAGPAVGEVEEEKAQGKRTFAVPPSALIGKLQAFLPQMRAANESLAARVAVAGPDSVRVDHIGDDVTQVVEMDLAMGVLEPQDANPSPNGNVAQQTDQFLGRDGGAPPKAVELSTQSVAPTAQAVPAVSPPAPPAARSPKLSAPAPAAAASSARSVPPTASTSPATQATGQAPRRSSRQKKRTRT
eukprot:g65203.t1